MELIKRDPNTGYLDRWLWLPRSQVSEGQIKGALLFKQGGGLFVKGWRDEKDHILVPRNFLRPGAIGKLAYPVIDTRILKFPRIKIRSKVVLDRQAPHLSFQRDGVAALQGTYDGILCLRCGAGKTVCALHAAAALKTPILVIVDEDGLMQQWKAAVANCLELEDPVVGIVGGGKFDWEHDVVIASVRTLARRAREGGLPPAMTRRFGVIIPDECIAAGALVRMSDGSQRAIEYVSVGDYVATPLGPRRVEATKQSRRECVRVSAGSRDLWLTPNHPLAWKEIYGLQSVWETALQTVNRQGGGLPREVQGQAFVYAHGALPSMQEGGASEESRRPRNVVQEGRRSSTEVAGGPGRGRDREEKDGCNVESHQRHPSAMGARAHEGEQPYEGPGRSPQSNPEGQGHDRIRPDAGLQPHGREGHGGYGIGAESLGGPSRSGLFSGGVFGNRYRMESENRGEELHGGLSAQDDACSCGDRRILACGSGTQRPPQGQVPAEAGLLGAEVPGDLRAIALATEGPSAHATIDMTLTELRTVHDLQVEEARCFYANDMLVHNCQVMGAPYFNSALPEFHGRRWGLSATPHREDQYDPLLRFSLGPVVFTYLEPESKPHFYFLRLPTANFSREEEERVYTVAERFHFTSSYGVLAERNTRTELIAHEIRLAVKKGRTVLVLSQSVRMCEALAVALPGAGLITGKVSGKKRMTILASKNPVICIMKIGEKALDKANLDTIFIVDPLAKSGRLQQLMGRALRLKADKKHPVVIAVEDYEIGPLRGLCNKMRRLLARWPDDQGGAIPFSTITPGHENGNDQKLLPGRPKRPGALRGPGRR